MAITYPVDPASRWAFYRQSDQTILRHNVAWPRKDGMEIVELDPDIVPLRNTEGPRPVPVFDPENPTAPVYDPATQIAEGGPSVVDVNANTYTRTWVIRALTQEELDENAINAANEVEKDQAKAVYADLKNGVGTQIERLERLEKVAAHLLKAMYGDVA